MVNIPLFTVFYTSRWCRISSTNSMSLDFFLSIPALLMTCWSLSPVLTKTGLAPGVNIKMGRHRTNLSSVLARRSLHKEAECPITIVFSYVIQMENVGILWGVAYKIVPPCTYTRYGLYRGIALICPHIPFLDSEKSDDPNSPTSHFAHHLISPPRGIGRFQIQM